MFPRKYFPGTYFAARYWPGNFAEQVVEFILAITLYIERSRDINLAIKRTEEIDLYINQARAINLDI